MQHGILNALRQIQAPDNSLESLSQLPLDQIMRMVQSGSIGKDMILPITGKKAQMAEDAAKRKAMQQGGGQQQASILEKKMAQIAENENPVNKMRAGMQQQPPQMQPQMQAQAPMTPENTGVAQLPIPPRSYAGGGIVAFENNKDQPVDYRMPSRDDEGNRMPYNPAQGAPEYISDVPEYLGSKLGPFFSGIREQINTGRVAPGATFNPSKQAPPTIATAPIPAQAKKEPGIVIHPSTKKPSVVDALRDADIQNQTQGPSEASQAIALMRKDLEGSAEERKEARKDARNLRFAQAGAGIAGGTSPYFFTNVGQGAAPAIQGYGEDIKSIRAEEADRKKQLAALGLKGIELKQAEKELGAKLPMYAAAAKKDLGLASYYGSGGSRGAGYGGVVTPEVTRKMIDTAKALAANPKSDPTFFASLSPEVQQALKTPVGSPSYNRGLAEAKKAAESQMMQELQFIGSLNRKSPAPSLD
jgi:hypothetical protein